jgi:uncharacterized protein
MITKQQEKIILDHLKPYSPVKVGVFGSYVRSEETGSSDLDVIIELHQPIDLLELIGLEQELSELLGIKVDLVTEQALSKHLKPYIEKEIRYLLQNEKR